MLLLGAVEYHRSVTAQSAVHEQVLDGIGVGIVDGFHICGAVHISLGQSHAVLGQSTGLIGTDNGRTAQSFHCRQAADQRVLFHHALYADGKNDGYDSGKAFGNGRYSQGNGGHKHVERIQVVDQTYHKDDSAGTQSHDAQVFTQLSQLLLQGSLAFFLAVQQVGDLTHFRVHTGGGNHSCSGTVGYAASGEHHIVTVTQRSLQVNLSGGLFFGGNGFTGQGGFFTLQADAVKKTGIRGNKVAGFQTDNIAGHQLSRLNDLFLAVTDDAGVGSGEIFQRIQCFFRFAFLIYTHDGVQDNDQHDQTGLKQLTPVFLDADDYERHDSGGDQNQDHNVLKLVHEPLQGSLFLLFAELVQTVFFPAGGNFV